MSSVKDTKIALVTGAAIRGFVTAEDSKSEADAVLAANRAIRELDA